MILDDCVQENIRQQVQASPVFGLLCDKSTDTANLKQLIIFIRFLIKRSSPCTSFLEVVNIQDGKAATIEEELEAVREKWGIPMAKVTGSGSDGEAVMVGCREGVLGF